MRWPLVLTFCLVLTFVGCSQKSTTQRQTPRTAEQTLAALTGAVQQKKMGSVFVLLDQQSRWSVMTIHKNLKQVCSLVRSRYPKQRQARAMERCAAAAGATDARAYFVSLTAVGPVQAALASLASGGPQTARKVLCQQKQGRWSYCGLRKPLQQLELKSARDLQSTRENADTFGQQ